MIHKKNIIAIVGMPGAGKSEATAYLQKKGFHSVRFGQITDDGLTKQSLPITPENERVFREQLRKELGMAAYAIKSKPLIDKLFAVNDSVILDGMYSWEEYKYLKKEFTSITLIHVYAERAIRYVRLANRKVRPLTHDEAEIRDYQEIEKLNKGGPIAIADYMIENNESELEPFYKKIDSLLKKLHIL